MAPRFEKGSHSPTLVFHPDLREMQPQLFNTLEAGLGNRFKIAIVKPDTYSDKTPHLSVPDVEPGTHVVVIPGFISGRFAEPSLFAITKTAHALGFPHPGDSRSPWAKEIHLLLTDLEGRGNKPTATDKDEFVDEAELHYAFYLADLINASRVTSATVVDGHDYESIKALNMPVTTLSTLPLCCDYMKKHHLIPENSGVVIADNGAIARSLFFAKCTNLPVLARIVKERKNGKVSIKEVHGAENVNGRPAIIVDDMIATGGTLFSDDEVLHNLGATETRAVVTHTKGVKGARQKTRSSLENNHHLRKIIMTNSTPYYTDFGRTPGIHVVNIYPLITMAAKAILDPNERNQKAIDRFRFPMGPFEDNLQKLWEQYPDLAPDYNPKPADSGSRENITVYP